jgi:hypothetical protein
VPVVEYVRSEEENGSEGGDGAVSCSMAGGGGIGVVNGPAERRRMHWVMVGW